MSENQFSSGDLLALQSCLRDLDTLLERFDKEPSDLAVRYSVVKTFELTYEMAVKTLYKYLLYSSMSAAAIEAYEFQDVIRQGDQDGLLRSGWPAWKIYRENRNRTAHTYREEVALAVISGLRDFSDESHVLLDNLTRRVKQHG